MLSSYEETKVYWPLGELTESTHSGRLQCSAGGEGLGADKWGDG